MQEREMIEINRSPKDQPHDPSSIEVPAFFPRLWMIMVPLAVPFLTICLDLFESLERTGPVWAQLAAPLLSTTAMAYVALIFLLKKSNV